MARADALRFEDVLACVCDEQSEGSFNNELSDGDNMCGIMRMKMVTKRAIFVPNVTNLVRQDACNRPNILEIGNELQVSNSYIFI